MPRQLLSRTTSGTYLHTTNEVNQSWLQAQCHYDPGAKVIQSGTYFSSSGLDLGPWPARGGRSPSSPRVR